MADDKTFGDWAVEILEILPLIISTGLTIEQAISWGITKFRSYQGGDVPSDEDWEELAAFRAQKKTELKANVEKLLAQG